jgi:hypothetical protein
MNKISPLDIRVAVLAHPFVIKEDAVYAPYISKSVSLYQGDERIVSVYQNSPKPIVELNPLGIPPLLRKAQLVIFRVFEILRTLLDQKEKSTVLEDVALPRRLLVPQLPYPPFRTARPSRFFWHPAYVPPSDGYAPSCLMAETREAAPAPVANSAIISAYARQALPRKGVLRQGQDGYVYLELPDTFITEIYPLIQDKECEAVSIFQIDPSPAHIPVILPHEWSQKKGWGEIKELEETFHFEVKRLESLRPTRWPGVENVYFFEISSPELERFRERLLLPSRIRGHEFHVAIAIRKSERAGPLETFRLNVSCFAA